MSELKALRQSIEATHEEMANEMGISLREYRDLESRSERLDDVRLRCATIAALRIAVEKDGALPMQGFGAVSPISRTIH